MKVIIIDDEPLARSIIREYLSTYAEAEIVAECNDGFEGLKAIAEHQPQLIFLDIQMPKLTGFEMLELVDHPPQVIFATAFEEYAIKAFETHAIDYLLKPFSKERFDKAWQKALQHPGPQAPQALLAATSNVAGHQTRVVVKDGASIRIIPASQIQYLEAADDYVKLHTKDGVLLKNKTMQFFEDSLDPQIFVRTHRSYMVNVQLVTRIVPNEKDSYLVSLSTGAQVPVSKTGYSRLRQVLDL